MGGKTNEMSKRQLSAIQAARVAGIRLDALYSLLWVGKIPAQRVDGRWRIAESDLRAYIEKRDVRKRAVRFVEKEKEQQR